MSDTTLLRQRLVGHARAELPPQGAKQRALMRLGLLAPGATVTTALMASSSAASVVATGGKATAAVTVASILKWAGIGVIAGLATTAVIPELLHGSGEHRSRAEAQEVRKQTRLAESRRHAPAGGAAPGVTVEAAPSAAPGAATAVPETPPRSSVDTAARAARLLAEEVRILERARAALRASDANGADRALGDYEKLEGPLQLSVEASALRVEMLLAKGERKAALARARRLLASHPRAPVAERVRAIVAELEQDGQ